MPMVGSYDLLRCPSQGEAPIYSNASASVPDGVPETGSFKASLVVSAVARL
jgi:hypothetical protein